MTNSRRHLKSNSKCETGCDGEHASARERQRTEGGLLLRLEYLLADDRVAREHLSRLGHRLVARRLRADRESAAPLRELAAALLVLSAASVQVVEALSRLLAERSRQRDQALIHL